MAFPEMVVDNEIPEFVYEDALWSIMPLGAVETLKRAGWTWVEFAHGSVPGYPLDELWAMAEDGGTDMNLSGITVKP